jgi:hypothetical protein
VVSAGEKVVTARVKRAVAVMTGLVGMLDREDGYAKAAEEAELVIGAGKAVVRVLAGKVVKGNSHHGVSRGGKSADMGRGGGRGRGCKEIIVSFLEAAVDVAAKVGKLEGAVGEIRQRRRGGRFGKVILKEGGTSRMEQSALGDDRGGFACQVRRTVWWVEGK